MIHSTRFGDIDAPESQHIRFPLGIPGFPDAKGFVLLEHRTGSRFRWLQAVDVPALSFVVIDVSTVLPDFPFAEVRRSLACCDLEPDEELAVLAICRIPSPPEEATANFQAPIGIGLRSRRGAQILLHNAGLDMHTPLHLARR
ncbi:MAG: flagellar assembly protein FliW [Myxococcales bacterium]|nr:flagellar assembly protein FliW [Myxococcales bacterium]